MDEKEKKWLEVREKVDKLFKWFDSKRSEIIAGHHGEQVLIHDYKVIGYYIDEDDADNVVAEKGLQEGDYIIQDCVTLEEELAANTIMGGINFA